MSEEADGHQHLPLLKSLLLKKTRFFCFCFFRVWYFQFKVGRENLRKMTLELCRKNPKSKLKSRQSEKRGSLRSKILFTFLNWRTDIWIKRTECLNFSQRIFLWNHCTECCFECRMNRGNLHKTQIFWLMQKCLTILVRYLLQYNLETQHQRIQWKTKILYLAVKSIYVSVVVHYWVFILS